MAITEQDIINNIPTVFFGDEFEVLIVLRSLASIGFAKGRLYKNIDKLIKQFMKLDNKNHRLNKETWALTPIQCRQCLDTGTVYRMNNVNDESHAPCRKCKLSEVG